MANNQWTPNFNESEFTVSKSHPDLVEPIPMQFYASMKRVAVELLQPIRIELARPMQILSGYRSEVLNHAVGGSPTSQHRVGEAADFTCSDIRGAINSIIELVQDRQLDNSGQIIYYPHMGFVHISLRSLRFPTPTLCINWPEESMHYYHIAMTREAFDTMVPPSHDPSNS